MLFPTFIFLLSCHVLNIEKMKKKCTEKKMVDQVNADCYGYQFYLFLRFFDWILELFRLCVILELFKLCVILELFRLCVILELFRLCVILELFRLCVILELFRLCGIITVQTVCYFLFILLATEQNITFLYIIVLDVLNRIMISDIENEVKKRT